MNTDHLLEFYFIWVKIKENSRKKMKNKDINFVDNLDGCSDIIKIPTKN
jgi:hypothetical protein